MAHRICSLLKSWCWIWLIVILHQSAVYWSIKLTDFPSFCSGTGANMSIGVSHTLNANIATVLHESIDLLILPDFHLVAQELWGQVYLCSEQLLTDQGWEHTDPPLASCEISEDFIRWGILCIPLQLKFRWFWQMYYWRKSKLSLRTQIHVWNTFYYWCNVLALHIFNVN